MCTAINPIDEPNVKSKFLSTFSLNKSNKSPQTKKRSNLLKSVPSLDISIVKPQNILNNDGSISVYHFRGVPHHVIGEHASSIAQSMTVSWYNRSLKGS